MSAPFVNLALEQSLLSSCLSYDGTALQLAATLRAEDFYDHRHAAIYRSIRDGEASAGQADFHAVVSDLAKATHWPIDDAVKFVLAIREDQTGAMWSAPLNAAKIAAMAKARRMFQRFASMTRVDEGVGADEYLEAVKAFDLSDLSDGEKAGRWMPEIVSSIRDTANGKKARSRAHQTGIVAVDARPVRHRWHSGQRQVCSCRADRGGSRGVATRGRHRRDAGNGR